MRSTAVLAGCLLCNAASAHPGLHPQIVTMTERIHRAPEDVSLYLSRSNLYLQHGAPDWALYDASLAKCLDPDSALADVATARALNAAGWTRTSLAMLNESLAVRPNDADALLLRSEVLVELVYPRRAASDYERAIELIDRPRSGQLLRRAQLRAALGDADAALALEQLSATSEGMGHPTVLASYAIRLERRLGRFDAALARTDLVAATQRRQEPWVLLRAEILEEAGRSGDAGRLYRELAASMRDEPPRWTRAAIEAITAEADAGAARCETADARAPLPDANEDTR